MSPLNVAGLILYFVVLVVCVCLCYRRPCNFYRYGASLACVSVTWLFILKFTVSYPNTKWYEQGLNLFDVAYADVIWGGAEGNWGHSQILLSWAVVATVWTIEAPAYFQLFAIFGAMSGSYLLVKPVAKPANTIPLFVAAAAVVAFLCTWMLPYTNTMENLSWWLWALHACLIVPKFVQFSPQVDRGLVYAVLAVLSWLTHVASTSSPWPKSECQISITIDAFVCSLLTVFHVFHNGRHLWSQMMWAALVPLVSPGCVLGAFCAFEQHDFGMKLVTALQWVGAKLQRTLRRDSNGKSSNGNSRHWMNLGYWKSAQLYDDACRHMAEITGDAANLRKGDRLLCIGCGYGDELELFHKKYNLGQTTGLDTNPLAVASFHSSEENVELKLGSSDNFARGVGRLCRGEFNRIIAVDSVYHFDKTWFFKDCRSLIQKGDTLTITDVVIRAGAPLWVRVLLCTMGIRWSNQWTENEYKEALKVAGFNVVTWTSLEPHVLSAGKWGLPQTIAQHLDYVLISTELIQVSKRPTVAVIGSGMSGLVAAHLLQETHDVTIYEAGPKCGLVGLQQEISPGVAVDVPLRFIMPHYYSRLVALIKELQIPFRPIPYNASYQTGSEMQLVTSTSWVKHIMQHLPYVPYLAKLMFVVCFRRELAGETFRQYMCRHGLTDSQAYKIYSLHLSWMMSCTYDQVDGTPAGVILGFIRASNPFVRMYQASGNILRVYPSNSAVQDALLKGKTLKLNFPVPALDGSRIIDGVAYDKIIVATDAPAAGHILGGDWQKELKVVHHHKSIIAVHKDASLMPPKREDWRTFNVREDGPSKSCQFTVWLNKFLGQEDLLEDFFETWNPVNKPPPDLLIDYFELGRAVHTESVMDLWPWIHERQGRDGFYIAGAYAVDGMGLLEQACHSAMLAVEAVHRDMADGRQGKNVSSSGDAVPVSKNGLNPKSAR